MLKFVVMVVLHVVGVSALLAASDAAARAAPGERPASQARDDYTPAAAGRHSSDAAQPMSGEVKPQEFANLRLAHKPNASEWSAADQVVFIVFGVMGAVGLVACLAAWVGYEQSRKRRNGQGPKLSSRIVVFDDLAQPPTEG